MSLSLPQAANCSLAGIARRRWLLLGVGFAAALVVLGALYWDAVAGAYRVWLGSNTYSHCFLVLPIALYLIWERRGRLAGLAPAPDFRFLILIPLLSAAWLAAAVLGVLELQQFAVLAIVELMLLAAMGWRLYRSLMGPLLYLFLLVPTGTFLVPELQTLTAKLVVIGLHLAAVPVYSDGVVIQIPGSSFIVAEACAGLRFLVASIAFGLFFALAVYRGWRRRLIFVALSVAVPILANGIRAWGIIYLAYITNDATAVEADHIIYGWGFFTAVLLILAAIGNGFRERTPAAPPRPPATSAAPVALYAPLLATALAVALAAAGPLYAAFLVAPGWQPRLAIAAAPAVAAPWQAEARADDGWQPQIMDPDRAFRDAFVSGSGTVQRYVALYAAYGRHNNLVRGLNRLGDEEHWTQTGRGQTTLAFGGNPPATIGTAVLNNEGRNLLVWYYYDVAGTVTGSAAEAKLRQARAILLGHSTLSAFVAVAAPFTADPAEAAPRLAAYLRAMEPMNSYLAQITRCATAPAEMAPAQAASAQAASAQAASAQAAACRRTARR